VICLVTAENPEPHVSQLRKPWIFFVPGISPF